MATALKTVKKAQEMIQVMVEQKMCNKFIYGRGDDGGGGQQRAAIEAPNTLQSTSYAVVLDLLGHGEWEEVGVNGLRGIYLDGTPCQNSDGTWNFNNLKVETRRGTQDQSRMGIANTTESVTSVGVELFYDSPIERTVTGDDIDLIRVTVSTPNLSHRDSTTGDLNGTSVFYTIEYNSADDTTFRLVPEDTYRYKWELVPDLNNITGYSKYIVFIGAESARGRYLPIPYGDDGYSNYIESTFGTFIYIDISLDGGSTWTPFHSEVFHGGKVIQKQVLVSPSDNLKFRASMNYTLAGVPSYDIQVDTFGNWNIDKVKYNIPYANGIQELYGKTTSTYERQTSFRVTGTAPYTVRVNRITADSTTEFLQNRTFFAAIGVATEEKYRYPFSALAAIQVDATQFPQVPTRAYDCKMMRVKVPVNYDPLTRAYSGVWNGTFKIAWTDNPAWCFYDLITNTRYGLGERVPPEYVDKFALYKIAQYCDELVPTHNGQFLPRFTCNVYIQSQKEAYKVVQDFAAMFRGITYWGSGAIVPVQDAPKNARWAFTNATVENGDFHYQSTDLDTRFNAVNVTYSNPKNFYKPEVVYVEDKESLELLGYPNINNVTAFGCANEAEAKRLGRWMIYTSSYETDLVSFTVGADGAIPTPGDIIAIADTLRAQTRWGGRVKSATTSTVVLDAPFTFVGGTTYHLTTANQVGGLQFVALVPFGVDTTTDTVTLAAPFAQTVPEDSIFIISDSVAREWYYRVVSIAQRELNKYEINAVSHDPNKFAWVERYQPLPQYPTETTFIYAPKNLNLQEILYAKDGRLASKIYASWSPAKYANTYNIILKAPNGVLQKFSTKNTNIEFPNLVLGAYEVQVSAISIIGTESQRAYKGITLVGKIAPVSTVASITTEIVPNTGVILKWVKIPDVDVAGYEVRTSDTGWSGGTGANPSNLVYTGQSLSCVVTPAEGSQTFYVRAYDNLGNSSLASASVVFVGNVANAPSSITYKFADTSTTVSTVTFKWNAPTSDFLIQTYRVSLTTPLGTVTSEVNTTEWTTQANWIGNATFVAEAINIFGWTGVAGNLSLEKFLPNPVNNYRAQVIDNNVLLYWDLPAITSLPIDHIRIKRGPVWATAQEVGQKAGSFTVVFETLGGEFTYWAAVVDTDNNEGPPVAVTVNVAEPPDYILQGELDATFTGTMNNATESGGDVYLPVNLTETFQTHFTTRSWDQPSDQITAGYPVFIQPTLSTGYYEEVFDFISTLPNSKITVTIDSAVEYGSVTMSSNLQASHNGTTWVDYGSTTTAYAQNFRYVKVRVTATTPSDGLNLLRIFNINVKLELKLKTDSGNTFCNASDTLGTIVNTNVEFLDINSLQVTPAGSAIAYYDFNDQTQTGTYSVTSNVCTVTITDHELLVGQNVLLNFSSGNIAGKTYTVASVIDADNYTVSVVAPDETGTLTSYPQSFRIYLANPLTGARVSNNASWLLRGN
jgi:predicted phage tail protein